MLEKKNLSGWGKDAFIDRLIGNTILQQLQIDSQCWSSSHVSSEDSQKSTVKNIDTNASTSKRSIVLFDIILIIIHLGCTFFNKYIYICTSNHAAGPGPE